MKTPPWILVLSIAAGLGSGAIRGQISAVDPREISAEIEEIVRHQFYDPRRLAELDALTGDDDTAQDWLNKKLVDLGASHTGRWTPDQIDYYELFDTYLPAGLREHATKIFPPDGTVTYPGIGVIPRNIEGKQFVAYVYPGLPAHEAGVLVGDELVSVDGEPFTEITSFEGKVGRSIDLRVRRISGQPPIAFSVPVVLIQPLAVLRKAIRDSVAVIEDSGKRVGYVRLWTYAGPNVRTLLAELLISEPLAGADGLVLDMRGRWGGAPPDAAEIFVGRAPHMEFIGPDGTVTTANVRWRKPVVGIIDAGTRSGMEIQAYALQKAGVPLVGSTTAGAVLGGRPYLLMDDSLLVLAVMDVRVDGQRLEGTGVTPEIRVETDIRYSAGADPQRNRAIALLLNLLG